MSCARKNPLVNILCKSVRLHMELLKMVIKSDLHSLEEVHMIHKNVLAIAGFIFSVSGLVFFGFCIWCIESLWIIKLVFYKLI